MGVPTIVAVGGGDRTTGPGDPALEAFVAALGGGSPAERSALRLAEVDLAATSDLRRLVLSHDVVHLGGGGMGELLQAWGAAGVDAVLREAWQAGVVLVGWDEAAMCLFRHGVTRAADAPEPAAGLGLLPGSLAVGADVEPERVDVLERGVAGGGLPPGWTLDDGVALLFRGAAMEAAVASRPHARACRIEPDGDGGVHRTSVLVQDLATAGAPPPDAPGDLVVFPRAEPYDEAPGA
jgi:peptidase E